MFLNPAELKIDLLCRGVQVEPGCRLEGVARPLGSEWTELASGLEMILPGESRDVWVNAPVHEGFVRDSPYCLRPNGGDYRLADSRREFEYTVRLAPRPDWYDLRTARGVPMSKVGRMQGTFLSICLGEQCRFRDGELGLHCRFCRAENQDAPGDKTVEDVVETAAAARRQSGIAVVLLRGGYQGPSGLTRIFPYLRALKQEVGILVGLQFPPEPDLALYDQARALGADHFSFCFDFFNPDYFDRYTPGKSKSLGRDCFMRALEHCAGKLGKGRVSGEVIAGVEPVEDTLRAIDYFAGAGALPFVCVFRPMPGTEMEDVPPPRYDDMLRVFRHVYDACRRRNLPIGVTPNLHVSVLPHPEDTLYLAPDSAERRAYERWIASRQQFMRPYFQRRMRKFKPGAAGR
jgi:hypothetical protein